MQLAAPPIDGRDVAAADRLAHYNFVMSVQMTLGAA